MIYNGKNWYLFVTRKSTNLKGGPATAFPERAPLYGCCPPGPNGVVSNCSMEPKSEPAKNSRSGVSSTMPGVREVQDVGAMQESPARWLVYVKGKTAESPA